MPLKQKYASAAEVPAELKSFYVERDGAWHLDAERDGKIDELRQTNVNLLKENALWKQRFDGINPDEVRALAEAKRKLEEEAQLKAGEFDKVLTARLADQAKQFAPIVARAEAAEKRLAVVMIDDAVRDAALKRGVILSAMPDVLARARGAFRLVDGQVRIFDGESAMVAAGIIANSPEFDALASGGGKTVDMPFWQDVTPARQVLSDSASLTVNKITASKDIAIINNDGQAWGANDLVGLMAGSDPLNALLDLVGAYWSRTDQAYVISCLKGLFYPSTGTLTGTNKLAIGAEATGSVSASTRLNGDTFVDATVKLGDCSDNLTAIAMHSATEAALRKLDLIDYLQDSQGTMLLRRFQGRQVIVDDSLPVRAGTTSGFVYTSYLFGPGAFARGNATLSEPVEGGNGTKAVEWGRVALDSDTNFINRRRYILHPRGCKFTSSSLAGSSPTNAELETAANWTRVFEAKNCRIVAIDHNV